MSRARARSRQVAVWGKYDTGLAPGRLILAETDQANGLPHGPLKPALGEGSSSVEKTNSRFSRPHAQDGLTPKQSLRPGDVVTCEIDGIGTLSNPVVGRQ